MIAPDSSSRIVGILEFGFKLNILPLPLFAFQDVHGMKGVRHLQFFQGAGCLPAIRSSPRKQLDAGVLIRSPT